MDLRREQLRERGAHGFRPGRTACEIHVGIDREAHPRQQLLQALHLSTRQAHRLGEPQPRLDPAGILAVAVVIENALYPVAPHATVVAIGEDGGVLDGNADLVIEAVRHPAANLRRRGLARIQHHVERMVDVVGAAPLAQLLLEFRASPGRSRHSSISSPSHATWTPRRVSSACSVHVNQDPAGAGRKLVQPLEHTPRAALRQVPDVARAFRRHPESDHLVIAPERTVDQHAGGGLHGAP